MICNLHDQDQPILHIHREYLPSKRRVGTYITVCTRHRYYQLPGAWWATLAVCWCRLFHRQRSCGMPTAGRKCRWPITCGKCCCQYEITRPNSPRWRSPFRSGYDRTAPKTWGECDRQTKSAIASPPTPDPQTRTPA